MLKHLIVTGGTGYIGSRLVERARNQEIVVTVLGRGPGAVPWHLGERLPASAFNPALDMDSQAVVHLAHDWSDPSVGDELNMVALQRLIQSSRDHGLQHFVFASSQSARKDAANVYGQQKWRSEQLLTRRGEISARIGLVYGGPQIAMYGLCCRLVRLTPVLPMIDPWREVQPIHLNEVCDGLLKLANRTDTGWFGLASPTGVAFGAVLKALAKELYGKRLRVLPVPLQLALNVSTVINWMPFGPTVDRERILGLAGTRPMDCAEHLQFLGLNIKHFAQQLRCEPASRKAALREARLVLGFMVKRPPLALIKQYAAAINRADPPGPLAFSCRAGVPFPTEPLTAHASPLAKRLRLAMALVEANPAVVPSSWMHPFKTAFLDVLATPLRVVSGLWYR